MASKIIVFLTYSKKVVIEKDQRDLANKILYYFDYTEEEEKFEEKGYNWAKTQTWEKVADLYLRLWKVKIPEVST